MKNQKTNIKRYSELKQFDTYEERLEYLQLYGSVAHETFGYDRVFNQKFYRSSEWKRIRKLVIARDNGCDLGVDGYDMDRDIIIHHMNPLSKDDIIESTDFLMNPEYLICVSPQTHNAIHYGEEGVKPRAGVEERKPNDTKLW